MRYSRELTLEFLVETIAKNLQYIFLVLGVLNLTGVIDFQLNPKHFPSLSISSEISKIVGYTYNPIFIYGHYLYVFFLIAKGFALGFFETIKTNWITGAIVCILIVNIWMLYNKINLSPYGKSVWKIESVLGRLSKSIWRESNLLEKGLWMMFFLDLVIFITTPKEMGILFLIIIYLLMLSIKFFPGISYLLIDVTKKAERSVLYDKRVLLAVTVIDIALIYFDSTSLFALFLITLIYNGLAVFILKFLTRFRDLHEYAFYAFNFGILLFFFSIALVYWIAFLAILLIQSPVIAFYYYKYKRFISRNVLELVNGVILAALLYFLWF
ncbi:hypothetical protein J4427_01905 [Candidatus Woesearchaeota archaeon]|nr:hypothetical protein [Candidatus Woesearchaeota archaeon]